VVLSAATGFFTARQHICYRVYAIARLSVCHTVIEKRLKLGLLDFHRTVAPSL